MKSERVNRLATKSGSRSYVPERGDLVWLTFDPEAGHEQAGRRPAVILSPQSYNRRAGLAIVVPVTRQVKQYPFEITLPANLPVSGVDFPTRSRVSTGKCEKRSALLLYPMRSWPQSSRDLRCYFPRANRCKKLTTRRLLARRPSGRL